MKPILLMNHTLLSKKDWCETAPNSYIKGTSITWRQKAKQELVHLLCRMPFKGGVAAERGVAFENQVYTQARRAPDQVGGTDLFKSVVSIVRGGVFQKFYTKDFETEDYIVRVYGIFDVDFPDRIVDLKTTSKFNKNKYLGSGQDMVYRWTSEKKDFSYLVVEWANYPAIKRVEHFPAMDIEAPELDFILKSNINTFISWLSDMGLYELYRDCYSHKGLGWKSMIAKKGPDQTARLEAFYTPFRDKYLDMYTTDSNKVDF